MVWAGCAQCGGPTAKPEPVSTAAPGGSSLQSATSEPVETPPEVPTSSSPEAEPGPVPMVDVSLHEVPLEDIIFDTFGGFPRFVPLSQADEELINPYF